MLFERDQAMAVLLAHLSEPPPLSPRPPQPIADTLTRTMRRPILIVLAAAVISVAGAVAFVLANFLGTAGYQRTGPLAVLPAGETGIVASLAFNPSGDTLAIATSRTCLWSLAASHCTATVPSARAVAYSPDGKTIATGDRSGTVYLWHQN